jgi:hypothetical protein
MPSLVVPARTDEPVSKGESLMDDWQPVRIAPCTNGNIYWKRSEGRIIRVRYRPDAHLQDSPETKVYEIHPEDFSKLPHVPGGSGLIMDYQIQAD